MVRRYFLALLMGLGVIALGSSQVPKAQAAEPADQEKKRLARFQEYCKQRQVTHIVEFLTEYKQSVNTVYTNELVKMVNEIHEESCKHCEKFNKVFHPWCPPVLLTKPVTSAEGYELKHTLFLDRLSFGKDLRARDSEALKQQVAVSSGTISTKETAIYSIVATNGKANELGWVKDSVVITSGDVRGERCIPEGALIIAGGDIQCTSPNSAYLISEGSILIDGQSVSATQNRAESNYFVFPKQNQPLGVRFYKAEEDGLVAKQEKGAMVVEKVKPNSPYRPLQLQAGDVLMRINNYKVDSQTELNRLLCRAIVADGKISASVQRGEEVLVLKMQLPVEAR